MWACREKEEFGSVGECRTPTTVRETVLSKKSLSIHRDWGGDLVRQAALWHTAWCHADEGEIQGEGMARREASKAMREF